MIMILNLKYFRPYIGLAFFFSMILLFAPTWNLLAQDRVSVGFTKAESLRSLKLNQDWQTKGMGKILWPLIYDQLWILGPAPEYTAKPSLAERWETQDYQKWRFILGDENFFNDLIPVTAKDVAFSLNLFLKDKIHWNPRGTTIETIEIIDDHTLDIKLTQPHSGPYPPFYRIPILPYHVWEKYKNRPEAYENNPVIGSGAYNVKEFEPGKLIHLTKNNNNKSISAKWDQLIFKTYFNQSSLKSAIEAGDIDFFGYSGLNPVDLRKIEASGEIQALFAESIELYGLSFNLSRNKAIQKINVRKALLMAINREEITSKVFSGYAKEVFSFVYPELADYNPNINKIYFDRQEAARLFDQEGYRDVNFDGKRDDLVAKQDLTFSLLVTNTNRTHIQISNLIKQQLAGVGVKINLMLVDSFVYHNFLNNPFESDHDIAFGSFFPGIYQDWIWNSMKSDEDFFNQNNHANYINYAFDRIYYRLLTTQNPNRKSKYLYLMQKILTDDLPYALLLRPYKIAPLRKDLLLDPVISIGGISSELNIWNYVELPEEISSNQAW